MYKRSFIDYVYLFLKGIAMGSANKVPGVSGGMVALVLGFYEELIYTFQKFNSKAWKLLSQGRFKSFFNYINYRFLIAVFLGSFTAYFTVSLLIDYFLRHRELWVWSLFFGMVLGSIYYVTKKIKKVYPASLFHYNCRCGFGIVDFIFRTPSPNQQIWFVIVCGFVSVSGMALPGFSGSFILIILGNYVLLMVDAVSNIVYVVKEVLTGNYGVLQDDYRTHLLWLIFYFTLGGLIGLVLFSKVMGFLLKKFHDRVIAALLGFIIGSVGATWPWKDAEYKVNEANQYILDSNGDKIILTYHRYFPSDFSTTDFWIAFLFIVIGFVIIWVIEYFENKKQKIPMR